VRYHVSIILLVAMIRQCQLFLIGNVHQCQHAIAILSSSYKRFRGAQSKINHYCRGLYWSLNRAIHKSEVFSSQVSQLKPFGQGCLLGYIHWFSW
jgi:hypothetical protein